MVSTKRVVTSWNIPDDQGQTIEITDDGTDQFWMSIESSIPYECAGSVTLTRERAEAIRDAMTHLRSAGDHAMRSNRELLKDGLVLAAGFAIGSLVEYLMAEASRSTPPRVPSPDREWRMAIGAQLEEMRPLDRERPHPYAIYAPITSPQPLRVIDPDRGWWEPNLMLPSKATLKTAWSWFLTWQPLILGLILGLVAAYQGVTATIGPPPIIGGIVAHFNDDDERIVELTHYCEDVAESEARLDRAFEAQAHYDPKEDPTGEKFIALTQFIDEERWWRATFIDHYNETVLTRGYTHEQLATAGLPHQIPTGSYGPGYPGTTCGLGETDA